MSNPTDTNQASEDDRARRMEIHMAMLAKAQNAKDAGHSTVVMLGFAVSIAEELIRTEKLKLLAAVRERVVGEDTPEGSYTIEPYLRMKQQEIRATNILRNVQRDSLNKLEAEL